VEHIWLTTVYDMLMLFVELNLPPAALMQLKYSHQLSCFRRCFWLNRKALISCVPHACRISIERATQHRRSCVNGLPGLCLTMFDHVCVRVRDHFVLCAGLSSAA
jgi:hypothetical protein